MIDQTPAKSVLPSSGMKAKSIRIFLALFTGLGLCLRIYDLGRNSLWYDEVCHASAVVMPTIGQAIAVIRTHLMAMPLDYLVVWIAARFSFSEGILRLPAAIWGTLTIPLSYLLFRKYVRVKPALLAVFLLSISSLHIEYSQELRYYASLVFFYTLCSWLLIRALETPSRRRWILFTVVAGIGMYFHYFTLLCFIQGGLWLILREPQVIKAPQKWRPLVVSGCILAAALIPAFLFFGKQIPASAVQPVPLLSYPYSILVGLGWIPDVSIMPGISWVWGALTAIFCLIGLAYSLSDAGRELKAAACGFLMTLGVILLLDVRMYFASPRQYLVLLPSVYLFCAVAIFRLSNQPINPADSGVRTSPKDRWQRWIVLLVAGMWILSAIPAAQDYYRWDKSRAGEISRTIIDRWQPGDRVIELPDAEDDTNAVVYRYYIGTVLNRPDIASSISPGSWSELDSISACHCKTYLVTKQLGIIPELTDARVDLLADASYQSIPLSADDAHHSQRLWVH
jgi:4-amino-4-deoxy-L-arabinose transferase-like glycosyltransferase